MPPKKITIVEDETFHPETCLVAMEAASGFIALEQYAEGRDSESWTRHLTDALDGLPVEIVQATSDEAKGLLKHARTDLGVHHSPDLFHPQHDVVRATSGSMTARVRQAEAEVADAHKATEAVEQYYEVDEESETKRSSRLPPPMRQLVDQSREAEEQARERLDETEAKREQMSETIRQISTSYHPFDLQTGQRRSGAQVEGELEGHFDRIERLGSWAGLSQKCFDRIAKARRLVPALVATITFFHDTIVKWVGDFGLSEDFEQLVLKQWIAGRYLELAAGRAQGAEERRRLSDAAAAVLPSEAALESKLSTLRPADRRLLTHVVEQSAQLFQRSSSCVEGRNGHLSLFHHGHHRLTTRKLHALTVIHNYLKERPDGTTAAERFFCQSPPDVFEWLSGEMRYPARPRKGTKQAAA